MSGRVRCANAAGGCPSVLGGAEQDPEVGEQLFGLPQVPTQIGERHRGRAGSPGQPVRLSADDAEEVLEQAEERGVVQGGSPWDGIGGTQSKKRAREPAPCPDRYPSLCPEVKTRERLPSWLLEAVAQAEARAKEGQTPIAVLHECGTGYDGAIVVMRLRDFLAVARRGGSRDAWGSLDRVQSG
jgi:hypothetical protein